MVESRNAGRFDWLITGLILFRFIASPFLFYTIITGYTFIALLILLLVITTDWLDGFLARRLKARARLHPFADAFADFIVVMFCFTAFVIREFYPFWLLLILIGMFVQFVLSSSLKRPYYDPLGKYYGVFLFAVIAVTLVLPVNVVATTVLISTILFTGAVLISRFFLTNRVKG